jgi:hypothetical protein
MDYPMGIKVEGTQAINAAKENFLSLESGASPANLIFKNNIIAGTNPDKVLDSDLSWNMAEWFGQNKNDSCPQLAPF